MNLMKGLLMKRPMGVLGTNRYRIEVNGYRIHTETVNMICLRVGCIMDGLHSDL